MAFISVTNTFVNATTADASQVNTNFTDITNGLSDGTKTLTVLTVNTTTLAVTSTSAFTGAASFTGQILAGDGTAALPSISLTNAATTGLYKAAANSLGFSSNGLTAGSIDSSGSWFIGASTNTSGHQIRTRNLGLYSDSDVVAFNMITRSTASLLTVNGGATAADGGNIILYGSAHASKASLLEFYNGSTLAGSISAASLWTIGTGTATQHALNTLLATNGAQVATITNLPAAATAGNPNGWLKITINGTLSYIPFWH